MQKKSDIFLCIVSKLFQLNAFIVFSESLIGPLAKLNCFYTSIKNACVGIFDNCLDFTVLDCVDNNELYRKLNYFYQIKYSKVCSKAYLKALTLYIMVHLQSKGGTPRNEQDGELCDVT